MSNDSDTTIDFVRELRLRQWARLHFVAVDARKATWHPVVLDEMRLRDLELAFGTSASATVPVEVPLERPATTIESHSLVQVNPEVALEYHSPLSGSGIVPLMPGSNWFLDEGSSEIPKPHARLLGQNPVEVIQSAEIGTFG